MERRNKSNIKYSFNFSIALNKSGAMFHSDTLLKHQPPITPNI